MHVHLSSVECMPGHSWSAGLVKRGGGLRRRKDPGASSAGPTSLHAEARAIPGAVRLAAGRQRGRRGGRQARAPRALVALDLGVAVVHGEVGLLHGAVRVVLAARVPVHVHRGVAHAERQLGVRIAPILDGLDVARVAPMQEGVEQEASHPWAERHQHQGAAEGARTLGVALDALVCRLQVVAEHVLSQEAHHCVAKDGRARALQRALPRHHRRAVARLNDLREDGQVHGRTAPGREQAQGGHQDQEVGEGRAVRRRALEDEPGDGDPGEDGDLRRDGPAVHRRDLNESVGDDASQDAAHGAGDLAEDADDRGLHVRDSADLVEERREAQRVPRHGAEAALQHQHAEGRHAEVPKELLQLVLGHGLLVAAVLGLAAVRVVRRLVHQEGCNGSEKDRDASDDHESQAPALVRLTKQRLPGQVGAEQRAAHGADVHYQLHGAEDLALIGLRGHVGDDAVGDWPQRRQHGAVQGPKHQHGRDVVDER
mmetsp:Transcript_30328/g.77100  ORF Transcript_30328/g.77100 Transcript_30328/m.77100 type:complete len:484 (-) Transcript_30328:490-1941(-)